MLLLAFSAPFLCRRFLTNDNDGAQLAGKREQLRRRKEMLSEEKLTGRREEWKTKRPFSPSEVQFCFSPVQMTFLGRQSVNLSWEVFETTTGVERWADSEGEEERRGEGRPGLLAKAELEQDKFRKFPSSLSLSFLLLRSAFFFVSSPFPTRVLPISNSSECCVQEWGDGRRGKENKGRIGFVVLLRRISSSLIIYFVLSHSFPLLQKSSIVSGATKQKTTTFSTRENSLTWSSHT